MVRTNKEVKVEDGRFVNYAGHIEERTRWISGESESLVVVFAACARIRMYNMCVCVSREVRERKTLSEREVSQKMFFW